MLAVDTLQTSLTGEYIAERSGSGNIVPGRASRDVWRSELIIPALALAGDRSPSEARLASLTQQYHNPSQTGTSVRLLIVSIYEEFVQLRKDKLATLSQVREQQQDLARQRDEHKDRLRELSTEWAVLLEVEKALKDSLRD